MSLNMKESIVNNNSNYRITDKSKAKIYRWLFYLTLIGLSCFVAAVILLHFLQPGLNPVKVAVSYYVYGLHGWLLTVGLVGLGIGSFALAIALQHEIHGRGINTGCLLLAIWSIGAIIDAIFPAEPPGNLHKPSTFSGVIHEHAALIAFLSLPVAAFIITRIFRRNFRDQKKINLLLISTILTFVSLGMFLASFIPDIDSPGPAQLFGLTERILLGSCILWIYTAAFNLSGVRNQK